MFWKTGAVTERTITLSPQTLSREKKNIGRDATADLL